MVQLVIAEKPSVARDLARVLGVRPSGKTCFAGKDQVITWCIGHLVDLDEPASYSGRWKAWRMDTLPMVPEEFKLRAVPSTREQLRAVCELLRDGRFTEVVNACDAGREGELIFRYVYQMARSRLPVRRLWISSLTDEAIRHGFAALKPGSDLLALADAARCRSEADWLVGLNATRAVTLRHGRGENSTLFSIGRVQTPTLAILVEREKQIRAFVPQDYSACRQIHGGHLLARKPLQPGRPRPRRGDARGKGQAFAAPFPLHLLERAPPKNIRDCHERRPSLPLHDRLPPNLAVRAEAG